MQFLCRIKWIKKIQKLIIITRTTILIIIKSNFIRKKNHRPLLKPKKYQLSHKMVYLKIQMSFVLFAVTQLFVFVARQMKKQLEQPKKIKIALMIALIISIKSIKIRNSKRKESPSKLKAILPLFPPLLPQISHMSQFHLRKRTHPKFNALKMNTLRLSSAIETMNYNYKLFETNENGFSMFQLKITCTF